MRRKSPADEKFWKLTIAAMIILFLAATAVSMVIAKQKVSRIVDTEYYSHGLHYGEAHPARKAGDSCSMIATIAGDQLQVRVQDGTGVPMAGGTVSFSPEGHSAAAKNSLVLVETIPGLYQAGRPVTERDGVRGSLRFSRGDTLISSRIVLFK